MALPSAVTFGSAALVLAAGVGLVAATANAGDGPPDEQAASSKSSTTSPTRPQTTRNQSRPAKATHKAKPGRRRAAVPQGPPKVFVEVYNNSGTPGLAAEKTAVLQGAGWNVAAPANWYGSIPATTVYFPADLRRQAVQLARVLHISRLHPAVSPMQFDRLTVIFTSV